ncbi:MAG: peptide-methionine (S)-S-oxide reductase MsrA [Cohaesibacteraceae bacterium]|nr:peptide-methionine (S)-S-oxide reductase MsrA [Cohaesibacteraceae bacterium]
MSLWTMLTNKTSIPAKADALPGRKTPVDPGTKHFLSGENLKPPFASGLEIIYIAMGCFWGAERKFHDTPGVFVTAVGYMSGTTENPTYQEVCTGGTGHTEAVMVVFDPDKISLIDLLTVFWENHDPTQGMRQGNDVGTQYRSGIYTTSQKQLDTATKSKVAYQKALSDRGLGLVTTEINLADEFYYAEEYHQQYLAKNPEGYCGIGGTGVSCPIGLSV